MTDRLSRLWLVVPAWLNWRWIGRAGLSIGALVAMTLLALVAYRWVRDNPDRYSSAQQWRQAKVVVCLSLLAAAIVVLVRIWYPGLFQA